MAESVKKLSAVCMKCKGKGSFTMKSENNLEQKIVQVGGMELFTPVCRECYHAYSKSSKNVVLDYSLTKTT